MKIVEPGKGIYGRLPDNHEILLEIATGMIPEYNGERWQNAFSQFVLENKFKVVVETGVQSAVSTDRILRALEQYAGGTLYSCDPHPFYKTFDTYGDHPLWRKEKMFSLQAMPLFFMEAGPYDCFIHDSNHEIECQSFEYEAAWGFTRPGGWICSDDWTWGQHNAWQDFCGRHEVHPNAVGSCMYVQKPQDAPAPEWSAEFCERITDAAWRFSHSVTDRPEYFR